ncbi:MAG: translocation/assembly module TamB, partial [Ferruginibacter sp.]|nr:translocation/assembly module TamB [Cytophagales bacterium]
KVVKGGKTVALDTLTLAAGLQQGLRFIRLDSEILKADLTGRFTVGELPRALDLLVKEYFSPYPTLATRLQSPQEVDFSFFVKEDPLVIESLISGLRIPEAIQLKGRFESNESRLVVDGTVPLLIYGSQRITGLQLDARTNERKLTVRAKAERVNLDATNSVPEPSLSITFQKDDATFNVRLANEKADTRLNFSGQLLIRKDTYNLRVLPSEVFIKKQKWEIAPNASLTYGPKYLWIDDLVISQDDQRIAVTSQRLSPGNVQLNTEIRQFEIGEFVNLVKPLGYSLGGVLDGTATVSDLFGKPAAQADLKMSGFSVDENRIGDVALRAGKASDSQQVSLSANVQGNQNDISLEGTYHTVQKENNLDFRLDIGRIRLAQFTVFAKEYVSELAGDLRASLTVQGSPEKPRVVGGIFFDSTLINAKFVNVPYLLRQQSIQFEEERVSFKEFTIEDNLARKAVLTGQVNYADLANTLVDLRFKTDAFQVLNTREGNGQPVYGNVLTAANLTVRGPVTSIVVDGDVRILNETRLGVPLLDGSNQIQQADYIRFVVSDTVPPIDTSSALPTSAAKPATSYGFALNMRIRTQPEAVLRVILDEQSGDALECSGRADLKVAMSAQGDINLVGDYGLEKGQYAMNLFGLIKKEFAIEKGSTLRWTGDPIGAEVDITAVYQTRAARYELVANQTLTDPEETAAKSLAPVGVYLRMRGELLKPTITFDLKIPRSLVGQLDLRTEEELAKLRNNESDLNKQVFGLIALNRFVLDNVPNTGGGNGLSISEKANEQVGQTVSQLLTGQLNKLSDEYLGGVEFSVDLKSATEGAYSSSLADKQLAVNVSKRLLNDRLTVSVGSNVGLGSSSTAAGSGGGQTNVNDLKNIIGDFSVQYRLLKSGRLNLKFFRRVDPNILNSNSASIVGASVQHTRSFNRFRDFFRSRKRKRAEVGVE